MPPPLPAATLPVMIVPMMLPALPASKTAAPLNAALPFIDPPTMEKGLVMLLLVNALPTLLVSVTFLRVTVGDAETSVLATYMPPPLEAALPVMRVEVRERVPSPFARMAPPSAKGGLPVAPE